MSRRLPFRNWTAAPVPHGSQILILAAIFMSLFALFAIALIFVRRYSIRHPEALSHFYRPLARAATAMVTGRGGAAAR